MQRLAQNLIEKDTRKGSFEANFYSGDSRETHKMMLDHHHQQTKNLLVNYSEKKLGFF